MWIWEPAPDFVLHGGKVLTCDAAFSVVLALAIKDGRILAVGDDAAVKGLVGPHTMVVDLGGRTVVPGVVDAHNHLVSTGRNLTGIVLHGVRSIREIQSVIDPGLMPEEIRVYQNVYRNGTLTIGATGGPASIALAGLANPPSRLYKRTKEALLDALLLVAGQ